MTLDALSPTAALIVVDVQAGTLPNARAVAADDLVPRVAALVDAFHASSRPVVFVASTGTPAGRTEYGDGARIWPDGFAELDARLDRRDGDPLVERAGWSAFAGSDLATLLADRDAHEVVLVGIATTYGVESTARDAYDRDLDVIVVADAVSDPDPAGHERTLTRVVPALGRVATSDELLAALG
jgi:nicotinamidase-related amidase